VSRPHPIRMLLLFLGISGFLQAEEPVARVVPEAASIFVYEPFTVRLEITGAGKEPELPSFPQTPGLTVSTIRHSPPTKFGAQTVQVIRIELVPERAGILTIPPIGVRVGDRDIQSPPLRVDVLTPHRAEGMDLKVSITPTGIYVDQAAELTVTWSSRTPFSRLKGLFFELPLLGMKNIDVYPIDPAVPEPQRIGLPLNQQRVMAKKSELPEGGQSLTFSFKLVPRAPGVFRSGEAKLGCDLLHNATAPIQYISYFNNSFFEQPAPADNYEQVYLSAPIPELTVTALPVKGRTERYAGIVGPCTATASVEPRDPVVGQPMLLTVSLDGVDFGRSVNAIPAAALDGLKPEFHVVPEPIRETATATARSFTYVVRPLRAGLDHIPAVAIQCFDPRSATYETIRSASIPIHVAPDGTKIFYEPDALSNSDRPVPLAGIRQNPAKQPVIMNIYRIVESAARFWWLCALVPPLLWLLIRPLARHLDRCRRDPAYARASRAARNFRRAAPAGVDAAWRNYLADRLDMDPAALTSGTVTSALEMRGVDPSLVGEVRDRLEKRDAALYSKGGAPGADPALTRTLVERLQRATRLAILLLLFIPFSVSAQSPENLFEKAIRLRAEKPDEAIPLFTRAALAFEAQEKSLDAANSWFFAGENGRALANYRAAESRAPFDRQIRESIAFIRAQATGAIVAPDSPIAGGIGFWGRFSRMTPPLRVGWIVLVYLFGWLLFFVSRLRGFRVHRVIWIVLAIAILVPSASLITSLFQHREGVIIQQATARLGPGYAYDQAFQSPLVGATEFLWLEERDGWIHSRFPDNSEAWLPEPSVALVR